MGSHEGDGGRGVLELGLAREAHHYGFAQTKVAMEHVGRVGRMGVVAAGILGCHCRGYAEQWQNEIFAFHSEKEF